MTCNRLEDGDLLGDLTGTTGATRATTERSELDAHVEHCADCRARLRGHQRVAGWIAAGTTGHRPPADWKAQTLARVARVRGRRRRIVAMAAIAVAAGALAIIGARVLRPAPVGPDAAPRLAMQIVEQGGWRGEAHAGEQVRARAELVGARSFEIRVYRGARDLLVRCPAAGPPACLERDGSLLAWTLPSVGTYQVVLLVGLEPIAAPRGSLDDDVAAATARGARVVTVETLHVD
jgi:hypothetical protein